MDIKDCRAQIDEIDAQMTELFARRMRVASDIAQYKRENKLPVSDPARERALLKKAGDSVPPPLRDYVQGWYRTLFEMSRAYQRRLSAGESPLQKKIRAALMDTPALFPQRARVACQGVEGAFSQQACGKLFKEPEILFFNDFEGVFAAVDKGLCRYGVLPLENSTAGSVNRIYDLMAKYDFSIVRATRAKVDHCLLVNPGAALADIREVVSHEQALAQCADFLKSLGGVRVTPCENTAAAARMVFESGRRDLAALCSRACAGLYGLDCLQSGVQDSANNYTRFICISKKLEIYPGADKTSVMMVLPHRPGSLYGALGRFYALGVNLIKLESRPIPGSDFEFMFYFDLETQAASEAFPHIFDDIEGLCPVFRYLGSYTEVI